MQPSPADEQLAAEANAQGVQLRGKPLTGRQIQDWHHRGALRAATVQYPGRPAGGSTSSYPEGAVDVVAGLAAALDESPRDFPRAVLVAFARGVDVGDRGLRDAYWQTYNNGLGAVRRIMQTGGRVRLPSGLMRRPVDWLIRESVFALALDEVPLVEGLHAFLDGAGLPQEIITEPPDDGLEGMPGFPELVRHVAYLGLRRKVQKASRDELAWACGEMRDLYAFVGMLAAYVEATASRDDAVNHVFRTLVAGGRLFARLDVAVGRGASDYRAALFAPVLLSMFDHLPQAARGYFDRTMRECRAAILQMEAMYSLVEDVPPSLRRFLGFDHVLRFELASDTEQAELQETADRWAASHPHLAERLRTRTDTEVTFPPRRPPADPTGPPSPPGLAP